MKSNTFLLILSGVSIIFLIASTTFVLYNNSKCKNIGVENEENEIFAEKYFDLLNVELEDNSFYDSVGRGAYLFSEWINEYENKVVDASSFTLIQRKYNNFLEKLLTTFENEFTFLNKDTTYSTIDNNGKRVFLILKKDGKYQALSNKCLELGDSEGNYKIINNEIVLVENNNKETFDILFLYKHQNIIQSITWNNCESIIPGLNLFIE